MTDIEFHEKCTTFVINNGQKLSPIMKIGKDSKNDIYILRKTIKDTTLLELYYYNTLGGISISINSFGLVQAINTLEHIDSQIGVPRNIIARWLSETKDPEMDYEN